MNKPDMKKPGGTGKAKSKSLWALYVGLIAGIIATAVMMDVLTAKMLERSESFLTYNRELLETVDSDQTDPSAVTAVFLGNSRMRYALDYGLMAEDMILEHKDRPVHVVEYAWDAARFYHYEDLWPHILDARPDFIVVQDLILTSFYSDRTFLTDISDRLRELLDIIIRRESTQEKWQRLRFGFDVPCPDKFTYAEVQERIGHVAARDRHRLEGNIFLESARDLIRQARDEGIEVIILHLPGYVRMLKEYDLEPYMLDTYGLDARPAPPELFPDIYQDLTWVNYITPPHLADSFCDLAHYDEEARTAFSSWMLDQLIRLDTLAPEDRPTVISNDPVPDES